MRISISKYLRQHLLHIQSSSLKLRHMFKFNTKRSTIAGSECETFEGTEYRSQSVCKITVRMSNHSVTVTLSNTHIWIRRSSHTLASLQQTRSKLHISSQTSIRTHSSLWTVLTHFFLLHVQEQSLTTELKDSRNSLKIEHDAIVKATLPQFSTISVSHIQLLQYLERNTITSCISDTIQHTHRLQCHHIDITEVNGKKNMFWLSGERLRQFADGRDTFNSSSD